MERSGCVREGAMGVIILDGARRREEEEVVEV